MTTTELERTWKYLLEDEAAGNSRQAFAMALAILDHAPSVGPMLGYSRGYILHVCSEIRKQWADEDGLYHRPEPRGPFGYDAQP